MLIDDEKISANVFNYDEYEDIAIIYIDSKYINSFIPLSDDNFDSNVYVEINTSDNVINGELLSDIMPLKIHYGDTYKILDLFKLNANIVEGNSGSPVINDKNEIIGMVSMIDINTNSSYAIPSSSLLRIIDYLENGKYILNLGFDYENYDNDFKGVIINNVISGFEADLAGMISGDIILSINNIEIVDVLEFNYYLSKYRDKNLVIKYYRDGSYYDTVIGREV